MIIDMNNLNYKMKQTKYKENLYYNNQIAPSLLYNLIKQLNMLHLAQITLHLTTHVYIEYMLKFIIQQFILLYT